MKTEIVVPQIGEAVAELTLVAWIKHVGDPVKKGDVLFEVDSDKAIVEVEAFVEGKLVEILKPDGSTVLPQDVVAYVESEAAVPRKMTAQEPASEAAVPRKMRAQDEQKPKASPVAQRVAADMGVDLSAVAGSGRNGRILRDDVRQQAVNASPKARQLARERQIDLRTVTARAADGMIRVGDVEALQTATRRADAEAIPPAREATAKAPTKLRQIVAQRTQQSKQTVPHFYLMVDADMSEVNQLRDHCRERLGWPKAPTYTDILLRACACALIDTPTANVSYGGSGIVEREGIHIGVAVNSDEGLLVPVIPNVDRLNLRETSAALREAAERARSSRLKASDTGEKSLVISNLGMYAVDAFIAIIDQPDPMILAAGRVADKIVPLNGAAVIRPTCTLTLSVDHRALDGAQAARFLERVKAHLEHPYSLMGQGK